MTSNVFRIFIMPKFYGLGVVALLVFGFQHTWESEHFQRDPMNEYYQKRMIEFRASQIQRCHDKAIALARLRVDSILIGKKILVDVDTFLLRPRPEKPLRPDFRFEVDTGAVAPIFD